MSNDFTKGRHRTFSQWAPKRRTSNKVQLRRPEAPMPPDMPPFPNTRPANARGNGPWIPVSSSSESFAIAIDRAAATPSDSSRQPAAPTPLAMPSPLLNGPGRARNHNPSTSDPFSLGFLATEADRAATTPQFSTSAQVDRPETLQGDSSSSSSIFPQVNKPPALLVGSSSNFHSTRNHTLIPEFSRFQKFIDQRDRELSSRPMGLYAPIGEPEIPPASTFHYFARLPTEVRLQIWALLNPSPQIFHISYEKILHSPRLNSLSGTLEYWGTWCILSPKPRLPNLFICQESRHECRKLYSIVRLLYDDKQGTFFNFAIDTLFLTTNVALRPIWDTTHTVLPPHYGGSPFSHKIRHLAIGGELWFAWHTRYLNVQCSKCNWRDNPHTEFFNLLANSMCKLETVKLVEDVWRLNHKNWPRDVYFRRREDDDPDMYPDVSTIREYFNGFVKLEVEKVWVTDSP